MPAKRKITKKSISLQDLLQAERNPTLQAAMRQKQTVEAILTGEDLAAIRLFARTTLPIARQRNKDITQDVLVANIVQVLKQVKPPLRKIMLRQLKAYVND